MKNRTNQFAPGLLVLLVAAVLLSVVGYFLHDYRDVPYGWIGAVTWGGALLITFVLGTIYLSRVLLPVPTDAGWAESFRLLWRSYLSGMTVPDGGDGSFAGITTVDTPLDPEVPPSFEQFGVGMLPSSEVASIVRGGIDARAAGPGIVFLESGETIADLYDLRPFICREELTANTRDGIPLETSITVVFRVRRPSETEGEPQDEAVLGLPYPYDPAAVTRLTYNGNLATQDDMLHWNELVCPPAAAMLLGQLAQHTWNDLALADGADIISDMGHAIKDELSDIFEPQGIEIVNAGVGPLKPPDEVVEQRIMSWVAGWDAKAKQEEAAGQAEAARLVNQARAQAQIEIIENLVQSIEAMRSQGDTDLHEVVMLRLLEVMDKAAADETVNNILPQPLLASLATEATNQIRATLEDGED